VVDDEENMRMVAGAHLEGGVPEDAFDPDFGTFLVPMTDSEAKNPRVFT
jgi:hypothetical protein